MRKAKRTSVRTRAVLIKQNVTNGLIICDAAQNGGRSEPVADRLHVAA